MSKRELYVMADRIEKELDPELILAELLRTMSEDELEANLKYIARMYNLNLKGGEKHNEGD